MRLSEKWPPPEPGDDFDGGIEGKEQNKVVLKPSLVCSDWYGDCLWDTNACAKEVMKDLEALNRCPMTYEVIQ